MATRRLQHLAEQLVTAAPRGVDPARALPTGQEDDLNKLAGDAGVPIILACLSHAPFYREPRSFYHRSGPQTEGTGLQQTCMS